MPPCACFSVILHICDSLSAWLVRHWQRGRKPIRPEVESKKRAQRLATRLRCRVLCRPASGGWAVRLRGGKKTTLRHGALRV